MQSRYYDPEIGRFINTDDTGILLLNQEHVFQDNLYIYCVNNPVNMLDNDGRVWWWVTAAVSGAIFDTASYLIECGITGKSVTWEGVGKAALAGAITGVAFGAIGKGIKAIGRGIKTLKTARVVSKSASVGVKIGTTFGKMGKLVKYRKIAINWGRISQHGLDRMLERGMSKSLINSVINNGKVLQQTANKFAYISKKGVVIIESNGKIVTAYARKHFDKTMKGYVKKLFG